MTHALDTPIALT